MWASPAALSTNCSATNPNWSPSGARCVIRNHRWVNSFQRVQITDTFPNNFWSTLSQCRAYRSDENLATAALSSWLWWLLALGMWLALSFPWLHKWFLKRMARERLYKLANTRKLMHKWPESGSSLRLAIIPVSKWWEVGLALIGQPSLKPGGISLRL